MEEEEAQLIADEIAARDSQLAELTADSKNELETMKSSLVQVSNQPTKMVFQCSKIF